VTARPSGAHEALLEFQAWWSRTNVELKPRSSTAAANSWLSSVPSPFVSYFLKRDSRPHPCCVATSRVQRKYSSISIVPLPLLSIELKRARSDSS